MEQISFSMSEEYVDKSKSYGTQGHEWHPKFIEYMEFIANHPVYAGMPDAFREDGTIQWEAPSNRQSGKYQHTHRRRLEWWREKATEVGIDPRTSEWISRAAKLIHPTGSKPCKECGGVLDLRYAYPSHYLMRRIHKLEYVGEGFEVSRLEHITDLVARLVETFGERVFKDLPQILKAKGIDIPAVSPDIGAWLEWIEEEYILNEPSMLSPGAMSNAPDRFDGFHSFNRCCRPTADPGRHPSNLRTYVTDRRVFEYWNEGDWVAADRLMGKVKGELRDEECLYGHPGPCSPDHIGPLSLGFTHRPEFQILCASCNSAKNNRMFLRDVRRLREVEKHGAQVISWYAKPLWDMRKDTVDSKETALRLSKLLRDNRHNAMEVLRRIAGAGHFTFLASLLELDRADYDVVFQNLRVENHWTVFDRMIHEPRETKYALEQKARRCRVAFESLIEYFAKDTRNAYLVITEEVEDEVEAGLARLRGLSSPEVQQLDQRIDRLLATNQRRGFRHIVLEIPEEEPDEFVEARAAIHGAMELVAKELSGMWEDDRYVRLAVDE